MFNTFLCQLDQPQHVTTFGQITSANNGDAITKCPLTADLARFPRSLDV
jgi:hypothetical protein